MNMPDMSGWRRLPHPRSARPDRPGAGARDDRRCDATNTASSYLALGLDGFVAKPLTAETLARAEPPACAG